MTRAAQPPDVGTLAWVPAADDRTQPACRNHPRLSPDAWFPGGGNLTPEHRDAIAVCDLCPIRQPCREWALAQPVDSVVGIWGGTTQADRRALRKGSGQT